MKTNWKTFDSLPLAIRKEIYKRDIDEELKNFEEFEKALRGDEPEEETIGEEEIEEENLKFTGERDGKITIIKGDDPEMNLEELILEFLEEESLPEEFFEIEKVLPESTKKTLKEAFAILNKYKSEIKANKELSGAVKSLARYIGFGYPGIPEKYPYPVKKELEKEPEIFNWKSFIEHMQDDEDIEEEIEKADPSDPFPSLTRGLLNGQRKRDKALSERDISMGRRFV